MSIEVKVPQLPESVAEATLVNWHKKAGEAGQARREPDRHRDRQGRARSAGARRRRAGRDHARPTARPSTSNEVIADDRHRRRRPRRRAPPSRLPRRRRRYAGAGRGRAAAPRAATPSAGDARGRVARRAQDDGREQGVEPPSVPGTGRGGRITKGDVARSDAERRRATAGTAQPPAAPPPAPAPAAKPVPPVPMPASVGDRPEQRVPMSRLRARIAERLVQSQSTAAILTTFNEVNMQPVIELRKRYKERFEKEHGVKLGFMEFFVKAAVHALKKYPVVNASVDGNDIVYHGYFDIGIAVGSPRGLVVPILRDADQHELRRHREEDRRVRQARAGRQADARGTDRRHVLDLATAACSARCCRRRSSIRRSRRSSACTRPRSAPVVENGQVVVRPMNYLAHVVRPPHHRRPRSRAVPGRDQGSAGGSGAAVCSTSRHDPTSDARAPNTLPDRPHWLLRPTWFVLVITQRRLRVYRADTRAPNCVHIEPGVRHWDVFSRLCRECDARGNLVPDAYLAAMAIESECNGSRPIAIHHSDCAGTPPSVTTFDSLHG